MTLLDNQEVYFFPFADTEADKVLNIYQTWILSIPVVVVVVKVGSMYLTSFVIIQSSFMSECQIIPVTL